MAGPRYRVVAVVGGREFKSSLYETKEEAQEQLRLISEAQGTKNPFKLDWLAVASGDATPLLTWCRWHARRDQLRPRDAASIFDSGTVTPPSPCAAQKCQSEPSLRCQAAAMAGPTNVLISSSLKTLPLTLLQA